MNTFNQKRDICEGIISYLSVDISSSGVTEPRGVRGAKDHRSVMVEGDNVEHRAVITLEPQGQHPPGITTHHSVQYHKCQKNTKKISGIVRSVPYV